MNLTMSINANEKPEKLSWIAESKDKKRVIIFSNTTSESNQIPITILLFLSLRMMHNQIISHVKCSQKTAHYFKALQINI